MGPERGKHQPHAQVTGAFGISKSGPESFGKASKTVCAGHRGSPRCTQDLREGQVLVGREGGSAGASSPTEVFLLGRWA